MNRTVRVKRQRLTAAKLMRNAQNEFRGSLKLSLAKLC